MAETRDLSYFVHHLDGGIARMELAVEGMKCGGCMRTIENGLAAIPQTTSARVNLTDRRVAVEWRGGGLQPPPFIHPPAGLGGRAPPHPSRPPPPRPETKQRPPPRVVRPAP